MHFFLQNGIGIIKDKDIKEVTIGNNHTGTIICIVLTVITFASILVAIKYKKLTIPDNIYGRATSKLKSLKKLKLRQYDNKG